MNTLGMAAVEREGRASSQRTRGRRKLGEEFINLNRTSSAHNVTQEQGRILKRKRNKGEAEPEVQTMNSIR